MAAPPALLLAARWLLALAAPAAALAVALLLQPVLEQAPSPPFVAAVVLVAWLGGFAPALLATTVSVAALDYSFLQPHPWPIRFPDAVSLALFAAVSVFTAWFVAGRGRVQARLASREQQLRLVTDTAPQLIYHVDAARRYRFANRPYAERYGLTPDAIVGRRVAEVVGAELYGRIERHLSATLAGRPTTFELTCPVAGGMRHLHAMYVPDVDRRGTTRGLVAVIHDITERKHAEDERARLLGLEQARRREAEAVAELGRILTEGLDPDVVAQRIAELGRGLLRATTTTVYRVEPASRDCVCLAVSGDMGGFRPGGLLPRGAGAVGRAVERGRLVTTANVLDDPEIDAPPGTREWIEKAPYRAVLAVPLRVKGRVVGAFAAGDRLGRVFAADEMRLAEALADHAAVALENARLYRDAEDRRHEAELLAELARAITASLDLDTVLGRVTAAAKELCGADLARIALWDAGRQGMVFQYTVGTRVSDHDHVLLTAGKGLAGEVLATGRAVRTERVLDDLRLHPDYADMIRTEGSVAVLVAPIRMGERIEGLLYLDNRTPRAFSERDETVLLRLADHASIALRNARLFAGEQAARGEAEARARRTRLLADISRALTSSTDYESTLDAVARLLVPARADWSVVHLARRDGTVRRVAVAYADPAHAALAGEMRRIPPTVNWLEDTSPAVQAVRAGRSLLLDSATAARFEDVVGDPADRRVLRSLQPQSMLVVPLVARGRTLGSLAWLRIASAESYTAEDLGLAEDVAARSALAIDSARLYGRAERARVEAEEANRAKDEFLAVLSHELRTPLTSMLGWLRLLRTGQLSPDKVAQALEVVERNTRTQAQLINDLLDVSRIITGKLQLDLYPVDVAPIMEEAVESVRRDAEAKGVGLELTMGAAGAGPVLGDPLRLGQIVGNVMANAVKFTSAGGHVRASLAREADTLVITIVDTGIGIEPALLAHIFDRFRQADSTITRRHGGLGLGLAIARHLAELHGGGVKAESAGTGRGSTFTIRLPLASAAGRRGQGEPVAAAMAGTGGHALLAGVRVLLVEDHRDTAELLRAVLGGQGAGVWVAESLAEALALLNEAQFDVLVSDIGMPDGNGYELVERLRERERAAGREPLPAVAVTAFAGGEDRERALAAGFYDYAAKPIEPAALIDTIARASRHGR
jgi:PAS domain S-box-containing protein